MKHKKKNGTVRKRRKHDLWIWLGRIAGPVALAAAVAAGVWWIHQPLRELSSLEASDIQVVGNARVTREEILSQAGLQGPTNGFQVDLEALAGRIIVHPWVRRASILRRLPTGLTITIEEREPVGLLLSGKPYLVTADGLILEELKKSPALALPQVRPAWRVRVRVGHPLDDRHLLGGIALLQAVRESPVLRQVQVEQVAVEADGYYTLHLAQARPTLRFGSSDPLRQLTRLDIALRHQGQELGHYAYVDLRFPGRVILKPWGKGGEKWGGRTT